MEILLAMKPSFQRVCYCSFSFQNLHSHSFAPYVAILLHRGRFTYCPFLLVLFKSSRALMILK